MKDDYISRAALISAFLNRQRSETEVKYHTIAGEDVLNMIQNAPAIDIKAELFRQRATGKTGLPVFEDAEDDQEAET